MLSVSDLSVSFGGAQALNSVSLDVPTGGTCAILGRNGAGKSTLLRTIGGLVAAQSGTVTWEGQRLGNGPSDSVRKGVRLVTESGNVFADLSVRDNLRSAVPMLSWRAMNTRIDEILDNFPILRRLMSRHAGNLSGGERQTVAVARALIAQPKLLLLDEPSLGLAPALASTLLGHLSTIVRERGVTLIVAEQNMTLVQKACDSGCWLETGTILARGKTSELGDAVFGSAEAAGDQLLG
jgi:branched-chain amino acid transport system ATP-binding protein